MLTDACENVVSFPIAIIKKYGYEKVKFGYTVVNDLKLYVHTHSMHMHK